MSPMPEPASQEIRQPRTDDRLIWDFVVGVLRTPAILVAHHLKLFPLLAERPRTLLEVCDALKIAARPAEALLTVCLASSLLEVADGRYSLSPVARDYLLETNPSYFGGFIDFLMIPNYAVYSFEAVKKAVLSNAAQVYGGGDIFQTHEQKAEFARAFTRAMHGHSMGAALAWPSYVDLSGHRVMLDIGGGSGAHSIGAALRWPDLQALVFDLPPVCEVAEEYIGQYRLSGRVRGQAGDMWADPYPKADVHFYSLIYHDWPQEKCRFLARKSFESLERGGRIIVHEMLLDDNKKGPPTVAAYNIAMLLFVEGQQYSGRELTEMLREAGFTEIQVKPTFAYWSIVTGIKPRG